MTTDRPHGEVVPYGSAYGLDHVEAHEALKHAAIVRLDHATLALAEFHLTSKLKDVYAEHVRDRDAREYLLRCSQAESNQDWAIGDLPEIYSARYRTYDFLKNWIVTLTVVGWKLAQQRAEPLTNVAEELALHLMIQDAIAHLDMISSDAATQEVASEALRDLYEAAYEDNDFLELYSLDDSDEITDLDAVGHLGMTDLRFGFWFVPFGTGIDRGVPHPFVLDPAP